MPVIRTTKTSKQKKEKQKEENSETIQKIDQMTHELLENQKNLNHLIPLIKYLEDPKEETKIKVIRSLLKIFAVFISQQQLRLYQSKKETDIVQQTVHHWIREHFKTFSDFLLEFLADGSSIILKTAALNAYLQLLRELSLADAEYEGHFAFQNDFYLHLLQVVLNLKSEISNDFKDCQNHVILCFHHHFLCKYVDLRFFLLKNMPKLFSSSTDQEALSKNLYFLLLHLNQDFLDDLQSTFFIGQPQESSLMLSVSACQKLMSQSWLCYLKQAEINQQHYKHILSCLKEVIIPRLQDPRLLHDFLTDSYEQGGWISLLSLQSLFHLMHQYNLDYPDFYPKLYSLFSRNLLHLPNQQLISFLKLAKLFLRSTHLPSYLVAAFIKRMARLCLYAPTESILYILPWIWNLLRDHKACRVLLHRESAAVSEDSDSVLDLNQQELELRDPYQMHESDPAKSNALSSSLWELFCLEKHFLPHVSNFVASFHQKEIANLNQFPYDLEKDFWGNFQYENLLKEELGRRMKGAAAMVYPPLESKEDIFEKGFICSQWSFE